MTRIPRTRLGYQPRALAWTEWGGHHPVADTVEVGDYPTHSPVLGPDGSPLEYEPRQPVGFDLRPKGTP